MLKIADFVKFEPRYLGPQIFPRHDDVCGSKLEISSLVSHILESGVFNDANNCEQEMYKFSPFASCRVPTSAKKFPFMISL